MCLGTGSGSFTHSIGRAIAPTGHLYTFEYHQERATKAQQEFQLHKIDNVLTSQCRDVCQDGFGMENEVNAGSNNVVLLSILDIDESM